nr:EAL domain-containing protein [uncultured Roseobacter sp.]
MVSAVFAADRSGYLSVFNENLEDLRSSYAARAVSQDFVFVAVDATSVRTVGEWPWSRGVHADILNNLTDDGALDVFFDFDFAYPGDRAGDAAFADALDQAGNAYLAVFQQTERAGNTQQVTNMPMPLFFERSWPALVNVFSDQRGTVRFYPYGEMVEGTFIPSAAAVLTGTYTERADSFPINFAFQPDTIPVLSAVDVASGQYDRDLVTGRSVIVGASAIELGDLFAVPVHGIIPGPLVHLLAAETLAADVIPATLGFVWLMPGLLVLLLFFQTPVFQKPVILLTAAGLTLVASEAAAFTAFSRHAIIVPTAALYPGLLTFCCWSLLWRLKLNRWVIRRQRQEVANTNALLRQVFDDSFDAIAVLDASGAVQVHSSSAAGLFGFDDTGKLQLPERLKKDALAAMQNGGDGTVQKYERFRGASSMHLEYTVTPSQTVSLDQGKEQKTQIATLSIRDVTEIKEQQREIAYLSSYDALTGALRRAVYLDFMEIRTMANEPFSVFVFNLSRFKTVNVVLGRDVGDALLQEMTERLQSDALNISAVARLGGDTFSCFTEFATDDAEARAFAARLCRIITEPYVLKNSKARVGVRMGFTRLTSDAGYSAADALSYAEEALDAARLEGDSEPRAYHPDLSKKQFRSREIERALGKALDREEFEVWYQPQHRLSDLGLIGSEALLRWRSGSMGPVYPDEFIEIAESTGFINELGAWVMERAVQDTVSLPGALNVAVNVSGIQMTGDSIVQDISRLLTSTGLPASRLCLELTETVLLGVDSELVEKMRDIQFRGVSWALDDFGTGYSSLAYLSKLPIDKLKVDKSFVMDLGSDPSAEPILKVISELSHGLGMTVLCEGVETEEHLEFLRQHRYAEAQGYLFGRPMPLSQFSAYAENEYLKPAAGRQSG